MTQWAIRSGALAASSILLISLAACSSGKQSEQLRLVRSDYPALPASSFAAKLRARASLDDEIDIKFFWGNYGGPGSLGGEPVDEMDWLFYAHDVSYLDGVKLRELRASDRKLIRELKDMDPDTLSTRGRLYRRRAMLYFRLPFSRWVGKPPDVIFRTKRQPSVIWIDDSSDGDVVNRAP